MNHYRLTGVLVVGSLLLSLAGCASAPVTAGPAAHPIVSFAVSRGAPRDRFQDTRVDRFFRRWQFFASQGMQRRR
jgi:hypothetical protein